MTVRNGTAASADQPSDPSSSEVLLSHPQRDMLWRVAQHMHGWTHVSRYGGGLQVGDALVRRGLVEWGRNGRDHTDPHVVATGAGKAEIARRWPISPFMRLVEPSTPSGGQSDA